ncbi:hypothetical protein S83_006947 [Arachis hypogaea]
MQALSKKPTFPQLLGLRLLFKLNRNGRRRQLVAQVGSTRRFLLSLLNDRVASTSPFIEIGWVNVQSI